jgi:hypothetical protein
MEIQNAQTLNAETAPAGSVDSSSSLELLSSPDSLTVGPTPNSSEETEKTSVKGAGDQGEKEVPAKEAGTKEEPWNKDPRFKEFLEDRKALKKEIAELAEIKETLKRSQTPESKKVSEFKDISNLQEDEIRQWMEEDPKGFTANIYAQVKHEVKSDLRQEDTQQNHQQRIIKTLESYKEKNPDFDQMWESGEISKFMQENPGHNALSAHMIMTEEKRIKAALKAEEDKIIANIAAKKQSRVLGAGPAHSGGPTLDEELSNTKERGGIKTVMAERLAAMRRGGRAA